jgi:hypothetical protein
MFIFKFFISHKTLLAKKKSYFQLYIHFRQKRKQFAKITSSKTAFLPTSLAPIGRARNALPLGNGGESRNPGKRDKMPSLAFYPVSFLAKTHQFFLLTFDAPSVALLVCD